MRASTLFRTVAVAVLLFSSSPFAGQAAASEFCGNPPSLPWPATAEECAASYEWCMCDCGNSGYPWCWGACHNWLRDWEGCEGY